MSADRSTRAMRKRLIAAWGERPEIGAGAYGCCKYVGRINGRACFVCGDPASEKLPTMIESRAGSRVAIVAPEFLSNAILERAKLAGYWKGGR